MIVDVKRKAMASLAMFEAIYGQPLAIGLQVRVDPSNPYAADWDGEFVVTGINWDASGEMNVTIGDSFQDGGTDGWTPADLRPASYLAPKGRCRPGFLVAGDALQELFEFAGQPDGKFADILIGFDESSAGDQDHPALYAMPADAHTDEAVLLSRAPRSMPGIDEPDAEPEPSAPAHA